MRAVPSLPPVSGLAYFSVSARLPRYWIRWRMALNLGLRILGIRELRLENERRADGREGRRKHLAGTRWEL